MTQTGPAVSIVMGSKSDLEVMSEAAAVLKEFEISHELRVISAHRTPYRAHQFGRSAKERGTKVIIAGAGKAAHLAGVMASLTTLPVIGVPMATSDLGGLDSLLSTVQMPGGIPVATTAIGKAGARNAGLLAVAMLALSDSKLSAKLDQQRETMRLEVERADEELRGGSHGH
jgi:phosphoribosylaminoimidazole carboxylase PurE protein